MISSQIKYRRSVIARKRQSAIENKNKKIQKSPVTCEIAIKSEMNSTDGEIVVRQGL